MIVLKNVSRWYGQVIGLNDVTCTLRPGLTALLGQNGAGKSTLMRLITGQLRPTTGELTVFGMTPFANPEVFKKLGYCPEIDNFYEHNTGRQFVRFLAELSGIRGSESADRTEEVLRAVGMLPKADNKIAGYSKGMRQRIKLAQAMLLNPEIILLDEPLNGLDPVGRREYIDLLHEQASSGKTVVVSSHILYEVEAMTTSILLLHRGRLLAEGDLRVIRSLIDRHPHRVRLETPQPRQLAAALATMPNVVSVAITDREELVEAEIRDPDLFYDRLSELARACSIEVRSFSSPDNNLESVFSYLVNT
jgi:ABC-2 type transport system ATP-binding protein